MPGSNAFARCAKCGASLSLHEARASACRTRRNPNRSEPSDIVRNARSDVRTIDGPRVRSIQRIGPVGLVSDTVKREHRFAAELKLPWLQSLANSLARRAVSKRWRRSVWGCRAQRRLLRHPPCRAEHARSRSLVWQPSLARSRPVAAGRRRAACCRCLE